MIKKNYLTGTNFLFVLTVSLLIITVFSYFSSSLVSRVIIVITFLVLITTLFKVILSNNNLNNLKGIFFVLLLASIFFLIWRSSVFSPQFIERMLNSEFVHMGVSYSETNQLVFDSPHSYFFLYPLFLYILGIVGGFSYETCSYISLLLFAILTTLIGTLIYKKLTQYFDSGRQNRLLKIFLALIAFSLISFAYSVRSGYATNFSLLLTLLTFWLLFSKNLRGRQEHICLLLLVFGVTIGDTNGALLLIPFILFYSFFTRRVTFIVYALIPLSYLFFSAQVYALSILKYTRFAIAGFLEFLQEVVFSAQFPERVAPWQRVSSRMYEDTIISSVTYISLFIISFLVVLLFTIIFVKARHKVISAKDARDRAGLTCLFLWLSVATITYIGSSINPETTFSDIRTIAVILLSLFLPFLFLSKKLISRIKSRKILLYCLIVLIVISSMRTVYEIYPKSMVDPIYVVEDYRLGSNSIYVLSDFLNSYYESGGIVGDYKTFNRIGQSLSNIQYERRLLNETTLENFFTLFPMRSILVFNKAGLVYPSIYHSPADYLAAYNYSVSHSRVYDNGIVVITSMK